MCDSTMWGHCQNNKRLGCTLCEILISTDGPVGDWRPGGTTTPCESMSSTLHCLQGDMRTTAISGRSVA